MNAFHVIVPHYLISVLIYNLRFKEIIQKLDQEIIVEAFEVRIVYMILFN